MGKSWPYGEGVVRNRDTTDRQQVADRVLRQAAPADLIPVDVKTRSGPFSQLLEIESKRYVEQTLVDRQLPYATSEVGQRFRGVIDAEINARILPLFACPTPVAGEPILFEETFVCRRRFAGSSEHNHAGDR